MATADQGATRPLGIVVAMDSELRHLLEAVPIDREEYRNVWLERHLTVGGTRVVAVRSGMGLVNAAAGTESLLAAHNPFAILNYGCAGAHRRDIMVGDVVIGERSVHHSAVDILVTGEERYRGFRYDVGGEKFAPTELVSDSSLLDVARAAAADVRITPWPPELGWPAAVTYRPPKVHVGAVASADVWTQSQQRLDLLHARHESLCEDMEAAAIAQVCALHGVPFLTIKDISNNEYHATSDLEGGFSDFPTAEVGRRATELALRVIDRLAAGASLSQSS